MPLDSPKRDLEHKVVLASVLAKHGVFSVIGMGGFVRRVHQYSRNCIWLGRFPSHDGMTKSDVKLREEMAERSTHLFFVHDEGAFYFNRSYEGSVLGNPPEK